MTKLDSISQQMKEDDVMTAKDLRDIPSTEYTFALPSAIRNQTARRVSPICESTVDPAELAHYESVAGMWWDTRTVAKWVHKYNVVPLPYIRDAACLQFGRDSSQPDCLRDLRVLDIGCGGGVLCEPLAQLGAAVVGVDPAKTAIGVATLHAQAMRIVIDYRCE